MAAGTYTDGFAVHESQATANTVDTITLTAATGSVTVLNRGTDYIYGRANDVGQVPTDPAVAANGTWCVPPGGALEISEGGGNIVVKVVSASAMSYSVQGL